MDLNPLKYMMVVRHIYIELSLLGSYSAEFVIIIKKSPVSCYTNVVQPIDSLIQPKWQYGQIS